MGLLAKDCGGQRTIIMSSDLRVQERDGAMGFFFNSELNGGFNGVDMLMELLDVVTWEGCQCVVHIPFTERRLD